MKIEESTWLEISEYYYNEMLECLPPLAMSHDKFISSEPYRQNSSGENLYFVGREVSDSFQARLMTVADYKAL
jgi:Protein of unknown function (DUF1419)